MKKKQTTNGQGTLKAKSAEVATVQYEYTSNITIPGVGQSLEDERFLQVAVGEKMTLLNVDNIADPRSGELKKLTPLGAALIKQAARTEFLNRAHDAARAEPTFRRHEDGQARCGIRAARGPRSARAGERRALFRSALRPISSPPASGRHDSGMAATGQPLPRQDPVDGRPLLVLHGISLRGIRL